MAMFVKYKWVCFRDITTKSISSVTPLGITIDSKLNSKEHINNIKKYIIDYAPPEDYKNF